MSLSALTAALSPKTCRFDIGRGGIPTLTALDHIAATAHGDQLGALLLELRLHGRGAESRAAQATNLARDLVREESSRRSECDLDAELAGFLGDAPAKARAARTLSRGHWPTDRETLDRIADVALLAVTEPDLCWCCRRPPRTEVERRIVRCRVFRDDHGFDVPTLISAVMPRCATARLRTRVAGQVERAIGSMAAAGVIKPTGAGVSQAGVRETRWRPACPVCRGMGVAPLSESKRARFLGFDRRNFAGKRAGAVATRAALAWAEHVLAEKTLTALRAYLHAAGECGGPEGGCRQCAHPLVPA